jgi:hypothetical protein
MIRRAEGLHCKSYYSKIFIPLHVVQTDSRVHSNNKKTYPWPESAIELYLPRDRRLSTKFMSTFADRGCHVVSVTDPYGRILGFLDRPQ